MLEALINCCNDTGHSGYLDLHSEEKYESTATTKKRYSCQFKVMMQIMVTMFSFPECQMTFSNFLNICHYKHNQHKEWDIKDINMYHPVFLDEVILVPSNVAVKCIHDYYKRYFYENPKAGGFSTRCKAVLHAVVLKEFLKTFIHFGPNPVIKESEKNAKFVVFLR